MFTDSDGLRFLPDDGFEESGFDETGPKCDEDDDDDEDEDDEDEEEDEDDEDDDFPAFFPAAFPVVALTAGRGLSGNVIPPRTYSSSTDMISFIDFYDGFCDHDFIFPFYTLLKGRID